jgi:hypothetical protein
VCRTRRKRKADSPSRRRCSATRASVCLSYSSPERTHPVPSALHALAKVCLSVIKPAPRHPAPRARAAALKVCLSIVTPAPRRPEPQARAAAPPGAPMLLPPPGRAALSQPPPRPLPRHALPPPRRPPKGESGQAGHPGSSIKISVDADRQASDHTKGCSTVLTTGKSNTQNKDYFFTIFESRHV